MAQMWIFIFPLSFDSCDNITLLIDDNGLPMFKASILPTKFRTNWIYIRVYILWMNMIVLILIPFVLLLYLNLKVSKILLFINWISIRGSSTSSTYISKMGLYWPSYVLATFHLAFLKEQKEQNGTLILKSK